MSPWPWLAVESSKDRETADSIGEGAEPTVQKTSAGASNAASRQHQVVLRPNTISLPIRLLPLRWTHHCRR